MSASPQAVGRGAFGNVLRLARVSRLVAERRLGAFLVAAALLLPVFFSPVAQLPGATYGYLFVIDVSESMNVRDTNETYTDAKNPLPGAAESRLDRAKAAVIATLAALPCGSRVAVALFAGSDALVLFEPLEVCRHFPAIEQQVRGIDWRMAWDGDSRIEAGVRAALREAGQRGLDLVFLSDGDEAPHVVVPHMADLLAVQGRVKGWLAGVGGAQPRPVPKLDADDRIVGYWTAVDAVREGFYPNLSELVKQPQAIPQLERSGAFDEVREHKSALDEDYLKLIGASAGLRYTKADSADGVASRLVDGALARRESAERDLRVVFGLAAALCVLVGCVRQWRPRMPQSQPFALSVSAQRWSRRAIRRFA